MIDNKVYDYIINNNLVSGGDKVLVALSGGPDSVCLLQVLNNLKNRLNITLGAAHINHMFRGEEAIKDEEYCRELCNKFGIDFHSKRIDVKEYCKSNKLSEEEGGREVRYKFFQELMNKFNYTKVATAHNANDQVETILMRIMRGTGLDGLCGIPVKREGIFIRPILFLERDKIEKYCIQNDLNPVIDKSNLEKKYSRNKIRLDIIPYMREQFNEDLIGAVNRMIGLLNGDNDYINLQVEKELLNITSISDENLIVDSKLLELHDAIKYRIIRVGISRAFGYNYDIELKHINDIIKLFSMESGKSVNLPKGIIASNVYGKVQIVKEKDRKDELSNELIIKCLDDDVYEFGKYEIRVKKIENNNNINFNKNNYVKYFNYDKINGNIMIRKRRNGDKISLFGTKGSKKIKDLFIDLKIPREEREEIPIVDCMGEIMWVVGYKVSETFKITKDTKTILKIEFREKGI